MARVPSPTLSPRALNRATLERQLLLRRSELPAFDAVEHLVGLQAQIPLNPYHGLWSRLERFDPGELAQLMLDRRVVRIAVMRATLHLVSAEDCLTLRPLMQPVLDAELARHPQYGPALAGVDIEPVLSFARPLLAREPHSGRQLRAAIEQRFPEHDAAALAYACRNLLAFVQVPPRGVWGQTAQVASTTAEAWLGRPLAAQPSIDAVVVRYLAAFGPATVADIASWSRLTGMRDVVERLRPDLASFRDERGRELLDLAGAPRPDPATPAPARFLPAYDNALLSHADRSRFHASKEQRARLGGVSRAIHGTVLHDGIVRATWRIEHDAGAQARTMVVDHTGALTKRATAAIAAEGRRLLLFLHDDRGGDVRFAELG